MVNVNKATKQVTAKIVYFGPGLSGKTTSLEFIYNKTSSDSRGEMVSLETDSDRTLFFDLLPIEMGNIGGYDTKFQLYTVPGQAFYESTRNVVLKGLDGMIFVADSQKATLEANKESLDKLKKALKENDRDIENIPMVFQYNKRDLDNIMSVETMEKELNHRDLPSFETVATTGKGIFKTLKCITKHTLKDIRKKFKEEVKARKEKTAPAEERVEEKQKAEQKRETSREEPLEMEAESVSSGGTGENKDKSSEPETKQRDEKSRDEDSQVEVEEEIEEIDHDRISSEIINAAGGGGSQEEINKTVDSGEEDALLDLEEEEELLQNTETEAEEESKEEKPGELDLAGMDEDSLLETLDSEKEDEKEETQVEFERLEENEETPEEEEIEMKRIQVKKPEDIEKTFEALERESRSIPSDKKKKKGKQYSRKDIDDYLSLNHKKSVKSSGSVNLSMKDLKNTSNIRVNLILEGEGGPIDLKDVLEINPGNTEEIKKLTLNLKLDLDSENKD